MACNASKVPFLRIVSKRGIAVNVCPRPVGVVGDVDTNVLGNKVVVSAADSALPITRVSVVFRAGSRNESYENQGAAHMMRIASGLTTKNSSGFAIMRNIQQVGGSLTATSDRETVTYTVETTSNKAEVGLKYLQDVIQPAFKPWELNDNLSLVKYQLAAVSPRAHAAELVHKAAFRTGLGNSMYIPKFQIGKLSSESLLHYVTSNYTANRCAVVGVGIDYNTLSGFAQSLELGSGSSTKTSSASYYGGDVRKDTAGNIAHVAVAGQGAALLNQKDVLAFAVLEYAVGSAAPTKRGNISGSFGKALASAVGDASMSFNTLNANYADTGLFGFVVSTDVQHIGKAVDALTRALKSGSISGEDVKRGKELLKAAVLEAYATDSSLLIKMGIQAVHTKQVLSADAWIAAIDGISQQDVQEASKKAGASKLSIGAVGNLANVPYASDLA